MRLEIQLKLLQQLYLLYDTFSDRIDSACAKFCSDCCTCNVTLTTLEGYYLINTLAVDQKRRLLKLLESTAHGRRFRPRLSTNELARRCIRGETIPEEVVAADWGRCPLLEGDLCSVYRLRPFGCRCFVSKTRCADAGSADVDEFVLTVNTAFMQAIEHVDAKGCSGNLTDVLLCLCDDGNQQAYRSGQRVCLRKGLIANHPMTAWMVPPAYRARIRPLIETLQKLCSN